MTVEQLWRKVQELHFQLENKEIHNKLQIFPSHNDDAEFLATLQELSGFGLSITEVSSNLRRLTGN